MPKMTFDEDGKAVGDNLDIVASAPEPFVQPATDSDSDDDEAPEAVSTKTARSVVLEEEKAKRDLAAKAAALEKEKRRLRDQKLKEQKQNSKRQKKDKQVEPVNEEVVKEEEEELEEESDEITIGGGSDSRLLPADLLAQAAAEESNSSKNRTHLSAADFERMEAEAAAEEAKKAKKRKVDERRVGEYTVKVINKRPRPEPTDPKILRFKERVVQRKSIPRRDALLQKSQHKKNVGNAALQFHRRK